MTDGGHLHHQRCRARYCFPDRPFPGVYFDKTTDKAMINTYAATVIPYHGAWLEYETDANDVFYVRIDKNRKLPITWFIKAMGASTRTVPPPGSAA